MPKSPSFFALISDIHGNIDALEAVLADMKDLPIRGTFCLGDMVGYGPEPAACVEKVREHCALTVMGNHEAMVLVDQGSADEWGDLWPPLALARKQLSDDQMAWLADLPIVVNADPITLCHSSLNDPSAFNYVDSFEEAEANFGAQTTFISFHGHTHVPVIWRDHNKDVDCCDPAEAPIRLAAGNHYAVNVGSVGQPRDEDPRATYTLYDHEMRIVVHRRVTYDIRRAEARFKKAGLPARFAARLKQGR